MTIIVPKHERDAEYLGDGVYVSHDGYQIWLRTERENGVHAIALEPQVIAALLNYRARMLAKVEQQP